MRISYGLALASILLLGTISAALAERTASTKAPIFSIDFTGHWKPSVKIDDDGNPEIDGSADQDNRVMWFTGLANPSADATPARVSEGIAKKYSVTAHAQKIGAYDAYVASWQFKGKSGRTIQKWFAVFKPRTDTLIVAEGMSLPDDAAAAATEFTRISATTALSGSAPEVSPAPSTSPGPGSRLHKLVDLIKNILKVLRKHEPS